MNSTSPELRIKQYFVTCEEPCSTCKGAGRSNDPDDAPPDWNGSAYTCVDCDGAGRHTREVDIDNAVRSLDEERNGMLYSRMPWHRYATVDREVGMWLAHNEAASKIAHTLTGYEQRWSGDEMARCLGFVPHMTFHGVRVAAIDDGELTLDVDGKRIVLYNRDERVGENIWIDHYLAKAWRGCVGEFGMLRITSYGWSFVTYPGLHALRCSGAAESAPEL